MNTFPKQSGQCNDLGFELMARNMFLNVWPLNCARDDERRPIALLGTYFLQGKIPWGPPKTAEKQLKWTK